MMAFSLLATGCPAQSRKHFDHAIALYDPTVHRSLAILFGQDLREQNLSLNSLALWLLGYPEASQVDTNRALKDAREVGQPATMFITLNYATVAHFLYGNYATVEALANELFTLADEQHSEQWKPVALLYRGWAFALTGRALEAARLMAPAFVGFRSTGSTFLTPTGLSILGKCYADLGQFDDAWRSVNEATEVIEKTGETWFEAYVYCNIAKIALKLPQPDVAKAEANLERALAVAR